MLSRRQQKDFVASLDNRLPLGKHRLIAPENRRDARVGPRRQVFAHGFDRLADQQTTLVGPYRHKTDPPPGKVQHLQGFRKLDQTPDVFGNHLLGTEREINREILRCQQAGIFEKVAGT